MSSKVLITADIHFGLPGRLQDTLWAVEAISDYATEHGIDVIFLLGDLFHNRVHTNIEVLNTAYQFLSKTNHLGQQWIIFPGNHDLYFRNSWGTNSLAPLESVATVINDVKLIRIDGIHRFWVLPFIHYESVYMKFLSCLEDFYQDGDVLLTHVGVNNALLNECFLIKNWSHVQFETSKFNTIFAGHFHCHQKVGDKVWYPGSPIPYNFAEGGVPHGFIEYDLDTRVVNFVDLFEIREEHPPDFLTIDDSDLTAIKDLNGANVRINLNYDYTKAELNQLMESLVAKGARKVKWLRAESSDAQPNLPNEILSSFSLNHPIKLFDRWVDYDDPDLDTTLLKKLNQELIANGSSDG